MPALESSLGPRLDLEPTAAGRFTLTQQALDSLGEDGEVFATLNGGSASERCSYEERYSDSSAVVEPGANRGEGSAPLPPKDVAIIRSIASARGLQACPLHDPPPRQTRPARWIFTPPHTHTLFMNHPAHLRTCSPF